MNERSMQLPASPTVHHGRRRGTRRTHSRDISVHSADTASASTSDEDPGHGDHNYKRRGHRSQWKYPERREQGRKGGPSYPEVHSSGGESEEEERRSAPRKGGHREMAGRRLRDSRTEDYLMEQLSDIRKVLDTLTHPGQNAPSDFSGRGIDHHEAPARTSQRPHPAPRTPPHGGIRYPPPAYPVAGAAPPSSPSKWGAPLVHIPLRPDSASSAQGGGGDPHVAWRRPNTPQLFQPAREAWPRSNTPGTAKSLAGISEFVAPPTAELDLNDFPPSTPTTPGYAVGSPTARQLQGEAQERLEKLKALEDMLLNQERQFESLENLEDFFLMSDSSSGHSVSSPEDDDMEEVERVTPPLPVLVRSAESPQFSASGVQRHQAQFQDGPQHPRTRSSKRRGRLELAEEGEEQGDVLMQSLGGFSSFVDVPLDASIFSSRR